MVYCTEARTTCMGHSLLIKVVVQSRHFRLAQWAHLSIRWRLPRPLDHSLSMFITRGKSLTRVINIDMLWSSGRGSRHLMLKSAHWAECIDQWFARLGFINRLCISPPCSSVVQCWSGLPKQDVLQLIYCLEKADSCEKW